MSYPVYTPNASVLGLVVICQWINTDILSYVTPLLNAKNLKTNDRSLTAVAEIACKNVVQVTNSSLCAVRVQLHAASATEEEEEETVLRL